MNGDSSLLRYARFDGYSWVEPIDIQRVVNGRIEGAAAHIDSFDTIHIVWAQRDPALNLYYTRVPVENALNGEHWRPPTRLPITPAGTDGLRLRVDGAGAMHLLFKRSGGIFYTRSGDQGAQWTTPAQLDVEKPEGYTAGVVQLEADDQNRLHAAWRAGAGSSSLIQYVRSIDGGATWSAAVTIDQFNAATDNALTQSVGDPYGLVITGDTVHLVWVGGPPGGPTGVGRKHRISPDGGLFWGPIGQSMFGGLWGVQSGDGLARDAAGNIYWAGLARNWVSQGILWEGLWSAVWSGTGWLQPERVTTILSPGVDSPRLASTPDGQQVAAFRNFPTPEVLYATHTTRPHFYLPHYADGEGWSMQLVINNLSPNRAIGALTAYNSRGEAQELPFETGEASRLELDLQPFSTVVLRTTGSSAPMKTGYIRVELDQSAISGVAIFQNTSGSETSVLPAQPGRRYALLVEKSASLQTGVAFVRHTPSQPITLKLFNSVGGLVDTRSYEGDVQTARFVEELFPGVLPDGFRGLLVLESEALFSAMGLRLGAGILSTLPVTDLDAIQGSGVYFFPHYADGGDLSMVLAVSNLSSAPAAGTLSVAGPGGVPQDLPFQTGAANRIVLNLAPNSTAVFQTSGVSNPMKTGTIRVQTDRQETSGLAIFKYTDGREASVAPSYAGRKFALFVERSPRFETGLAISRTGTAPVTLSLFDSQGVPLGSQQFLFDQGGVQRARALSEVFTMPPEFHGLLIMESQEDFTAIGLRFGGNVLSTLPVTPMK
jgi:hypothetical protein